MVTASQLNLLAGFLILAHGIGLQYDYDWYMRTVLSPLSGLLGLVPFVKFSPANDMIIAQFVDFFTFCFIGATPSIAG